jgi:hypothetical protein
MPLKNKNIFNSWKNFNSLENTGTEEMIIAVASVSDPHRFYVDPDPAFCWMADPDPDPTCRILGFLTAANFWIN